MSYRVFYDPEVHEDIQKVVGYYNNKTKNKDLGKRFFKLVHSELKSLSTRALHHQIRYDNIRLLLIPKFPYAAHYRVLKEQKVVIVEAIIGTGEDPQDFRTKE
ncbi:MAG: hypothetical protein R2753_13520 [Chitinophagales bacterium]